MIQILLFFVPRHARWLPHYFSRSPPQPFFERKVLPLSPVEATPMANFGLFHFGYSYNGICVLKQLFRRWPV
jgi:hypothetical protein